VINKPSFFPGLFRKVLTCSSCVVVGGLISPKPSLNDAKFDQNQGQTFVKFNTTSD